MKPYKFVAAILASIALSGCFHTQLNGSVGNSDVTIEPLRQAGKAVVSARSTAPDDWVQSLGPERWEKQSSFLQLLFVGITTLKTNGIDPDALYLVTASGGDDYDPEGGRSLSDNPAAVQGSWRAIVPGQRIIEGNVKVSPLTEAIYLQVQDKLGQLSDAQLMTRLDAAAQLTVGDVSGDGVVDYFDALRWHRVLDARAYLGDIEAMDALSDSITAGQPDASRIELAKAVLGNATVVMTFDVGEVVLETYNWEAPITAANFLNYVRDGFYDQMLVHRAINQFMIQAGLLDYLGRNEDGLISYGFKTPGDPIVNESSNGLSNVRGTIAMARTSDPNSATAQWFINQVDNTFLDFGSSNNPDGYAVFGRVISGIEIVDEVAAEPTVQVANVGTDVPARGVVIETVTIAD